MERQHQSTKVGVTSAGQRLANEAKCWRFHDVPIFSINNITRSLSEEFRRLGESKMIFVEGGAIGIARVIHKLTTHGLSENEVPSLTDLLTLELGIGTMKRRSSFVASCSFQKGFLL